MNLYATITSERATKGQGGKYLDIKIMDEQKKEIAAVFIRNGQVHFMFPETRTAYKYTINSHSLAEKYCTDCRSLNAHLPALKGEGRCAAHSPNKNNSLVKDLMEKSKRIGSTGLTDKERGEKKKDNCSACGEPLYGTMRVHHHTEDGVDVTQ